jgi:NitT/TauT family transport system substrate-binding protein
MPTSLSRRTFLLAGAGGLVVPQAFAQAKLEPVSLSVLPFASSGAVFIALDNGWFRDAGIDLAVKKFNTAGPATVAVVSGDADIGVTGLTAAFYNMAGKGALKLIAGQSREQPGYQGNCFVVSNKAWDEGVRTFPDLVGKRMGNTVLGSTIHYAVILAAKKYNVDPAKIQLVNLQSLPNMASAFRGGSLDAIVATPAMYKQLQADGVGKLMAWSGDLTPWQLGAVFTTPRMLKERRPAVEKFLQAYLRGTAAYYAAFNQRGPAGDPIKGPNYDKYLDVLAKVIGQTPAQVADALPYIDGTGRLDVQNVREQVANWQAAGQIDASIKADDIVDPSFVS